MGVARMAMEEDLLERLRGDSATGALLARLMPQVAEGRVSPRHAANTAVTHFLQHWKPV